MQITVNLHYLSRVCTRNRLHMICNNTLVEILRLFSSLAVKSQLVETFACSMFPHCLKGNSGRRRWRIILISSCFEYLRITGIARKKIIRFLLRIEVAVSKTNIVTHQCCSADSKKRRTRDCVPELGKRSQAGRERMPMQIEKKGA